MNISVPSPKVPNGLMLELDLLKTFIAIADTGSFKQASELVLRTPSAVSMQIKKLEDIVGRPVLMRDSRSVSLTYDGEILLSYARRMLRLNEEALSKFHTPVVEGFVRIGAPDDYGSRFLPQVLKRFAITHPHVVVDVVMDFSANLRKRVQSGELDLSLISCDGTATGDANVEVVFEEQLAWAGAKGGCAYETNPLPISVWEEGCAWRSNSIEALEEIGREFRVAYMSAYTAGQKAAVLSDLAVAPFPKSLIEPPLVHLTEEYGLPPLKSYYVGMLISSKAGDAAHVVADHIRASFEEHKAEWS